MAPSPREFKALYGLPDNMTPRRVLNTLMRQHWPGGSEILDVIERLHQMQHGRPRPDDALQYLLDNLRIARDKIAEAILADGLEKEKGGISFQSTGAGAHPAPTAPPCAGPENMSSDNCDIISLLGAMPDTALAAQHGVSHTYIAKLRRKHGIKPYTAKARVDWSRWDKQIRDETMTADGLAKLIGCDASTVRERRRYLHGEGGKYRPGAPLAEDRVDWRATDWAKSDAELGRLYGISRQAVRDARLRHAPK